MVEERRIVKKWTWDFRKDPIQINCVGCRTYYDQQDGFTTFAPIDAEGNILPALNNIPSFSLLWADTRSELINERIQHYKDIIQDARAKLNHLKSLKGLAK